MKKGLLILSITLLSLLTLRLAATKINYLDKILLAEFLYEDTNMGVRMGNLSYWDPFTTKVETQQCAVGDLCRTSIIDKNTISNQHFFANGVDSQTFELLGSCKTNISSSSSSTVCYAKDKNNYYKIVGLIWELGKVPQENVYKLSTKEVKQLQSKIDFQNGYTQKDWSLYFKDKLIKGADLENFQKLETLEKSCKGSNFYTDTHWAYWEGKPIQKMGNAVSCKENGIYTKFEYNIDEISVYFKNELMYKTDYGSRYNANIRVNSNFFRNLQLIDNLKSDYLAKSPYKDNPNDDEKGYYFCGSHYIENGDIVLQMIAPPWDNTDDIQIIPNTYASYDFGNSAIFECKEGNYTELLRDKGTIFYIYTAPNKINYAIKAENISY